MLQEFRQSLAEGVNQVINQTDRKNKLTPIAEDLRRELGWTGEHPMPTTAEELAESFGENDSELHIKQMRKIHTKERYAEQFASIKRQIDTFKASAPNFLYFGLLGTSFLTQIAQQAEGDSGGKRG